MASISVQSLSLDLEEAPAFHRFLGQGGRLTHLHAGNWVSYRSETVVRAAKTTTTTTTVKSRVRILIRVPRAVRVLPVPRRTNPPAKHPRAQVPALVLLSQTIASSMTLQFHHIVRTPTPRWPAAVSVPLLPQFRLRLAAQENAPSANSHLLVYTQTHIQTLVKLLLHRLNSIFWVFCLPQVGVLTRQLRLQTQLPLHHLQLRQTQSALFSKCGSP